jgi:ribosomal protein S20
LPITKSAKKSLKVSRTKKTQNDVYRKKLEIALKKVDGKNVSDVISLIDKTAKVGIIAKGKAARMKSQLTKKFGTPKKVKSKVKKENSVAKKTVAKKITTKK